MTSMAGGASRTDDLVEVAVSGLLKSFGTLQVLRGIDLEIRKGQVVCVIGPSGSGKSTLLRCINLLEEPTAGTVTVGGIELTDPDCDIDAARRQIGMVFQQFNLFGHLTVLDNITLPQRRVLGTGTTEATRVARANPSNAWASPTRPTPTRPSSRAASNSAPRSPGPSRWIPR